MTQDSPWFEPGRHHDVWKEWRRIGRGREEQFFLEHRHAVLESLRGHHPPEQVLLSKELFNSEPEFWTGLARGVPSVGWFLLETERMNQVTSVSSSSGLCAVFSPRPAKLPELSDLRFVLVLWEIADPGNLGTLIRAARSLCRAGVLVVGGCSAWSSKVARASAGSLMNTVVASVPLAQGVASLQALRETGFALHHAVPRGGQSVLQTKWSGKDAVVLGNESRGLPTEVEGLGRPFTIPSAPEVESLNVAMSGSILAWEWAREFPLTDIMGTSEDPVEEEGERAFPG